MESETIFDRDKLFFSLDVVDGGRLVELRGIFSPEGLAGIEQQLDAIRSQLVKLGGSQWKAAEREDHSSSSQA